MDSDDDNISISGDNEDVSVAHMVGAGDDIPDVEADESELNGGGDEGDSDEESEEDDVYHSEVDDDYEDDTSDDDEDTVQDLYTDDVETMSRKMKNTDHKQQTSRYLSKYEKPKAIAERAMMIIRGAPTKIKTKGLTAIEIATEELNRGIMPISIHRPYPDGRGAIRIPISQLIDVNQTI